MAVGNLDSYIGTKVNAIADLIGEYNRPLTSDSVEKEELPIELTQNELELCIGKYWNKEYLYTTEISIENGQLFHADSDNGFNFLMTPITKTSFLTPFGGTVEFSNLGGKQNKMRNVIPNGRAFDYEQYEVPNLESVDLEKYLGIYSSEQLEVFYQVVMQEGKLILKRSRKSDLELSPIGGDKFRTPEIDFRLIEFESNLDGTIDNMYISNPSLSKVLFIKHQNY